MRKNDQETYKNDRRKSDFLTLEFKSTIAVCLLFKQCTPLFMIGQY